MFYRDERLCAFIDGANLYAAARALGFDIDYKLLRTEFMRRGKLLRAFYYTALLRTGNIRRSGLLVDWLNYNGFAMVTKPAKEFTDLMAGAMKGNMDIDLAVDAMEMAPHVDHIVLFSGDGDFRPLVESLQRQGVRVSVVSTIRSSPPMIADELRRQCDNFIEPRRAARGDRPPATRRAACLAAAAAAAAAAAMANDDDRQSLGPSPIGRAISRDRPAVAPAAGRAYKSRVWQRRKPRDRIRECGLRAMAGTPCCTT